MLKRGSPLCHRQPWDASVQIRSDARLIPQYGGAVSHVVGGIAEPLFSSYLIPFEITSVLLLAAVIGAVVLAKKKL